MIDVHDYWQSESKDQTKPKEIQYNYDKFNIDYQIWRWI